MSRERVDARLAPLERLGIRLDLAPMRQLLAAAGDPQLAVPVVLVAGTNGKGSTAAMLAAIATAAGLRTGLATSPHLERVEERIRFDGEPIDPSRLAPLLDRLLECAAAAGLAPPTYFEVTTAAAFLAFAADPVDLAIVEVGLGGRLDAANAAEPILSLITPIALDHTEWLGTTLAAVATEKAGILRAGRPVVLARQDPEAAAPPPIASRSSASRISVSPAAGSRCASTAGRSSSLSRLPAPTRPTTPRRRSPPPWCSPRRAFRQSTPGRCTAASPPCAGPGDWKRSHCRTAPKSCSTPPTIRTAPRRSPRRWRAWESRTCCSSARSPTSRSAACCRRSPTVRRRSSWRGPIRRAPSIRQYSPPASTRESRCASSPSRAPPWPPRSTWRDGWDSRASSPAARST
ncbi:MAG: hypothetical protein K8I65_10055 [Thermoanaerobaculia bacterium]|nr:hypothetical protein [Thermoanaerobaculia bacterium]